MQRTQYEKLKSIAQNQQMRLDQLEMKLNDLENNSTEASQELTELQNQLTECRKELMRTQEQLQSAENSLDSAKTIIDEQNESYRILSKEIKQGQRKAKLNQLKSFLYGAGVMFVYDKVK